MGKRKQARPRRSVGPLLQSNDASESEFEKQRASATESSEKVEFNAPYYVEIDSSTWASNEHFDISEVILSDLNVREEYYGFTINEGFFKDSVYSLRFQLCNISDHVIGRIKLGHWPVLSSTDIFLELNKNDMVDNPEMQTIILSGSFDGPDEGITGLVHLTSLHFLTLRPVFGFKFSPGMMSLRVRVEILKSAFYACQSLLGTTRQLWKNSMMNLMAWLRPEVTTSEVRYGVSKSTEIDVDLIAKTRDDAPNSRKCGRFDIVGFYEAIKPSKSEPMLEDVIPDLLPMLRPYQRRAAYWMVKQEKGDAENLGEKKRSQMFSPLCISLDFLDSCAKLFYNPFSGDVSLHPEFSSPQIFGGILADEMGLGKTVELLACIFAHQRSASEGDVFVDISSEGIGDQKINLKRLKRERIECTCGAVSESYKYKGLWVQCDICDAWQHADCVGYSPRGKKRRSSVELWKNRNKTSISFVERDGEYVCQMCSELIEATESPIASGATLIVCPAPILPQWHAEITRHTRPGSLQTCVYEGVRDTSLSNTSLVDINELINADIVLTTYDVLKEDLSHDSDRHEGDRHCLRYHKRFLQTLRFFVIKYSLCIC
uniref:E3 ubiquitin-protein ligase SHPRH n=1 Tax=Rhizophora mucronata TaxID=61149 RepID=A0A2P2MDD6_RHIMU